jgi:hypothetical protein
MSTSIKLGVSIWMTDSQKIEEAAKGGMQEDSKKDVEEF